jgi:hypothetical protein
LGRCELPFDETDYTSVGVGGQMVSHARTLPLKRLLLLVYSKRAVNLCWFSLTFFSAILGFNRNRF